MTAEKWAVLRDAARNGWFVVHPGDPLHHDDSLECSGFHSRHDGRLECWGIHSRHDTWTEAMQEADRMARTITVTLPADPHVWLSGLDSDGRRYVRDVNDNEISYEPGQLETLALHLLAYDRKERR